MTCFYRREQFNKKEHTNFKCINSRILVFRNDKNHVDNAKFSPSYQH